MSVVAKKLGSHQTMVACGEEGVAIGEPPSGQTGMLEGPDLATEPEASQSQTAPWFVHGLLVATICESDSFYPTNVDVLPVIHAH